MEKISLNKGTPFLPSMKENNRIFFNSIADGFHFKKSMPLIPQLLINYMADRLSEPRQKMTHFLSISAVENGSFIKNSFNSARIAEM